MNKSLIIILSILLLPFVFASFGYDSTKLPEIIAPATIGVTNVNYTAFVNDTYVPYVGAIKNVDLNSYTFKSGKLIVGNGSLIGNSLVNIYGNPLSVENSYTSPMFATFEYNTIIHSNFTNPLGTSNPSATSLLVSSDVGDASSYYFVDGIYIEKIQKKVGASINSVTGLWISDQDAGIYNHSLVTNKGSVYHGDKVKINPSALYFDETDTPTEALDVVGNGKFSGNVTADNYFGTTNGNWNNSINYIPYQGSNQNINLSSGYNFTINNGFKSGSFIITTGTNTSETAYTTTRVGIGTTHPDYQFEVTNERIGVDGGIDRGIIISQYVNAPASSQITGKRSRGNESTPLPVNNLDLLFSFWTMAYNISNNWSQGVASWGWIINSSNSSGVYTDLVFTSKPQGTSIFPDGIVQIIKWNGNVGYGTTDPKSKLHIVNGNQSLYSHPAWQSNDVLIVENNGLLNGNSIIQIHNNDSSAGVIQFSDSTRNKGQYGYHHLYDRLFFQVAGKNMVLANETNVWIGLHSISDVGISTININGSTSITGNANITQNLYVGGNLSVIGITTDTGLVNISNNVYISGNLSVKRPYWNGYDNSTQQFADTAKVQVINISNNGDYDAWLINVSGNQNLTFKQTGDYQCTLSPEFFQNGGGSLVTFWYQKNGVDVPWSNSRYTMTNNEYHAPSIIYQFDIANPATDTIRFMWWSDSTSTQIYSSGALTSPTRPSIPGVLLTCLKVSEITP